MSLFADDTNIFCADLASVERALKLVEEFGKIAGLWLGKWANNTSNPLGMKWMCSPVKILGVHFPYDEKRNNELNFNQKLKVLQTKLDMWSARDLTLFGKVMIIKTLGLISAYLFSIKSCRPCRNRRHC